MHTDMGRAAKARELAQWFRAVAAEGGDAGLDDLMARTACALEGVVEDAGQDVVPDVHAAIFVQMPQQRPVAINDNAKVSRRRTKH